MNKYTLYALAICYVAGFDCCQTHQTDKAIEVSCDDDWMPDGRVPEDWIPFDNLLVKSFNTTQITQKYGEPQSKTVDTLYYGCYKGKLWDQNDQQELKAHFQKYPVTIVQTITWKVDSIRLLTMFYAQHGKGILKPVWGYQYHPEMKMFE